MIKDILQNNEALTPNSQTLEVLQAHFPQCFNKEGFFDVDKFKELIKSDVDITHEGYDLNFLGKNYAKLLASIDTTTVIQPDVEHNAKPENANSQNLYISGDNLDGLKHLLKSYTGAVKCIYIDPPYNTGSDGFVYNDNFNFTPQELIDKLSISEEQAQKIFDLTTKGRASHSAWLTFMYPRLLLARDLLTPDGVIFISIDDNEQANLKLICDSVFGEENFFANVTWHKNYASANDAKAFSNVLDYILVYQKSSLFNRNLLPRSDKQDSLYKYDNSDGKGKWRPDNLSVKTYSASYDYEIENPITGVTYNPPQGRSWMTNKDTVKRWIKEGRVFFGQKGDGAPQLKRYLNEVQQGVVPITYWSYDDCGHNDEARKEIKELFEKPPFDTPKPTRLINQIITIACDKNDTILDFFSGSGTTAHSILNLNSKDGGNRKFIMVQISEPSKIDSEAEKAGFKTLDQIGIERIKRAATKIKSETNADIDYGFKHYTLVEPSEDTIDKLEEFKYTEMFTNNDTLSLFGKETVLETWLVKDGYGFGAKVEEIKLSGYTAYLCGKHLYFIEAGINENDMVALLDRYQQEPSFSPENIVIFGYSFNFSQTEMLRKNLFVLRDTHKNLKANFDIRY